MTRYRIFYNSTENKNINTTYGELTKEGLKTLFTKIDTFGKTFYDLGSGKGSVIINAVNDYPDLKKVVGIEYVKARHDEALNRTKGISKVELYQGDFTSNNFNLGDADLIYISNLCLSDETNKKIAEKINREVKGGTRVFSSRSIPLKNIADSYNINVKQTWKNDSNIYVNKLN